MRSKYLLLAIAGICGSIAAVGASQWMQAQGTGEKQQMVEIYVTLQDIEIGDQFTAENIKLESWPVDRIPEGAIRKLEDVEGKYTNQRLYSGEPLISRKITTSGGNSRRDIPRDFSVVSLQTDPANSVATLVQPGDRVNVTGFFKKSDVIPQTMTQKILSGIRVYAVDGRKTRSDVDDVGKPARNISLLIHKKDEEAWAYANELGSVRLSLCHPDEYENKDATDGADADGQEFLRWIAEYNLRERELPQKEKTPVAKQTPQSPVAEVRDEPVRMTKMTGDSMEVYELRDGIWVVVQASDQASIGSPQEAGGRPQAASDFSYLTGANSPFFADSQTESGASAQATGPRTSESEGE